MSAHEQAGEVDVAGAGFIRSLMGAWDCCATCAGGVLLRHDREMKAHVVHEIWLAIHNRRFDELSPDTIYRGVQIAEEEICRYCDAHGLGRPSDCTHTPHTAIRAALTDPETRREAAESAAMVEVAPGATEDTNGAQGGASGTDNETPAGGTEST